MKSVECSSVFTTVRAGLLHTLNGKSLEAKQTDDTKPALFASFDVSPVWYTKRAGYKLIAKSTLMVLNYLSVNESAPTKAWRFNTLGALT